MNINFSDSESEIPKKKSLFEGLCLDDLIEAVRAWMKEPEPLKIDVKMISKHFRQLAIDREIEDLKVLFNFMHR